MANDTTQRGKTGISPANLQRYLKGADYPSAKEELIKLAENNGATDEILTLLDAMPDVEFESPAEVQECYGHIIGDDEQRGSQDDEEEFQREHRAYQDRRIRRQQEQQDDDDSHSKKWDHRLKGHESKAIKDAREMKHGYDGRGQVTDPDTDKRLADNASPAIDDARHMRHGYDGRGRVTRMGDQPGETIGEARERHEEREQSQRQDVDPETGSHSRRRKDDDDNIIRGSGQTFEDWLGMVRQRRGQDHRRQQQGKKRQTWREFSGRR